VAALNGINGAHVDWPDSKGLNEWEHKALELAVIENDATLADRPGRAPDVQTVELHPGRQDVASALTLFGATV